MSVASNGKFAGDIDTSSEECSRGVDCSGFVSNAWNLSDHYGTCNLETISTPLASLYELQPGDIMNRCSPTPRHVIIFDHFTANGMVGYESTGYLEYDRVVRIDRLFVNIADYTPRKYNNACFKSALPTVMSNGSGESITGYQPILPYPPPYILQPYP